MRIHILNERYIMLSEPFINGLKEKETFYSEKEDSFLMSLFLSKDLVLVKFYTMQQLDVF